MKQMKKTSFVSYLFALILMGMVTGCEKDIYNPDNDKGKLPPAENYFDFTLRGKVALNVDYHLPGFQGIIEVYDQNPIDEETSEKKEGLKPIYSAYTDQNGKFDGTMIVPTALKEAYLYVSTWGFPQCVKLNLTEQGASYDSNKDAPARPVTRGGSLVNGLSGTVAPYHYMNPNDPVNEKNLYSLCIWDSWFEFPAPANYLTDAETVLGTGVAGGLAKRSETFFTKLASENKGHTLLGAPGETNITIKEDGTELKLVFLVERGAQRNTFGYYYYKKGARPTDMSQVKKYIIAPDASLDKYTGFGAEVKQSVQLKYFGESGTEPGKDQFPAGYEIAWFYIRNAACIYTTSGYIQNSYGGLQGIQYTGNMANFSSSDDTGDARRFVLLKDAKTELLVLGFEDSKYPAANDDYSDLLFVVKSNKDVDGSTGEIPDDEEQKPGTLAQEGTLAFEDVWPGGGDYDLNDVIIEYTRFLTYNTSNNVTKIEEIFVPVQPDKSADFDNFFAYQVNNMGTPALGSGILREDGTNSFVINETVKSAKNKSFTITRTFAAPLDKNVVLEDFNPYIITKAYTTSNRIEVHLPKKKMTDAADKTKMDANNAYYVGEGGIYPFAIDIPIKGFVPADEKQRIDLEGQYPNFKSWAESKGDTNANWYNTGKGAK